jgi:uncharacterized protein (DUF2336 family)
MPVRITAELAHLARLARDGGLDLSQVSLRVKADLLLSQPNPPIEDLAAFTEMAKTLIPVVDEATAVILARKLAAWRYAPAAVIAALAARGGAVLVALLRHGMTLGDAETESLAEHADAEIALALAERPGLSAMAALILLDRGERPTDLALLANAGVTLPRAALDLCLARARDDAAYAPALLARPDLSNADLAPLFAQAGPERRLAILESIAAREGLEPQERRPAVRTEVMAGWLATAGGDPAGAFGAIAEHFGGGAELAEALAADRSRDLAALALVAAGASVEDATRFLIRLGDETAHSVDRIFALVALMRATRPNVASRLLRQIGGTRTTTPRKGQHQPAMDPSGTPMRAGAARPESHALVSTVMRKLGLKRDSQ